MVFFIQLLPEFEYIAHIWEFCLASKGLRVL